MLTFDDHFEISRGDDEVGNWCVLWADEPSFKRQLPYQSLDRPRRRQRCASG
jgi:hypothetical protein